MEFAFSPTGSPGVYGDLVGVAGRSRRDRALKNGMDGKSGGNVALRGADHARRPQAFGQIIGINTIVIKIFKIIKALW
jgi:hypothetical protein